MIALVSFDMSILPFSIILLHLTCRMQFPIFSVDVVFSRYGM